MSPALRAKQRIPRTAADPRPCGTATPSLSRGERPSRCELARHRGPSRDSRIIRATAIAVAGPAGFCCRRSPGLELFARLHLSAHKIILSRACKRAFRAKRPVPLGESGPAALRSVSLSPSPASDSVGSACSRGAPFSSPEMGGVYRWVLPGPVGTITWRCTRLGKIDVYTAGDVQLRRSSCRLACYVQSVWSTFRLLNENGFGVILAGVGFHLHKLAAWR